MVSGTTKKFVVVINEDDKSKVGRYAKEYLDYGEKNPSGEPYAEGKTCRARNPWWKLSPQIIPEIVFGELFSSTFIYPKTNFMLDHTMYLGNMKNEYKKDLLAVYAYMNSSISYLYPDFLGRNYGGGGAPTAFMVYEVKKLPVIKPEILRPYYPDIERIMRRMEARKIGSVFEEIWDMKGDFILDRVKEDRLELDRLLLKAIGIKDPDSFLSTYYQSVVKIVKERLDKAASLKTTKSGRSKASLGKVADEIIKKLDIKTFPDDYVNDYTEEKIHIENGNKITLGSDLSGFFITVDDRKYYYHDYATAKYVYYCLLNGREDINIAIDVTKAIKDYQEDINKWKRKMEEEVENTTNNEETRSRLLKMCRNKLRFLGL